MRRRKTVPPAADEQDRLAVCDEITRLLREKLAAPEETVETRHAATPVQAVALYREPGEAVGDTLRARLDDIEGAANVLQWLGRPVEGGPGVEPAAVRWIGEQLHSLLADTHALLDQLSGRPTERPSGRANGRAETIVVDPLSLT